MARMQRKLLSTPDEVRPFTHGRGEIWELGDAVIGKQIFEPGWRSSTDVKPVALDSWAQAARPPTRELCV